MVGCSGDRSLYQRLSQGLKSLRGPSMRDWSGMNSLEKMIYNEGSDAFYAEQHQVPRGFSYPSSPGCSNIPRRIILIHTMPRSAFKSNTNLGSISRVRHISTTCSPFGYSQTNILQTPLRTLPNHLQPHLLCSKHGVSTYVPCIVLIYF